MCERDFQCRIPISRRYLQTILLRNGNPGGNHVSESSNRPKTVFDSFIDSRIQYLELIKSGGASISTSWSLANLVPYFTVLCAAIEFHPSTVPTQNGRFNCFGGCSGGLRLDHLDVFSLYSRVQEVYEFLPSQ